MIEQCGKCGMIRATKDLVLLKGGEYICFSCWNRIFEEKRKKSK